MIPTRITPSDLDWWLTLAPTLDWTFAKTYADSAPHSYIVAGRTPRLSREDFVRAGRVVRTFGQPAKFYNSTNIYLTSPDGKLKWWTMDTAVADTGLINQATTDRVYGVQDAPVTRSGMWSVYDEIATTYDTDDRPFDDAEASALVGLLATIGIDNPTVLDIGCGTGAVLDLGITTPDRYLGVDPSQGMLNELARKHAGAKSPRITAMRFEDAEKLGGETFDLVIAAFGSASYMSAEAIGSLTKLDARVILLQTYADGYVPSYHDEPVPTAAKALIAVARLGVRPLRIGRFDTVLVTNA